MLVKFDECVCRICLQSNAINSLLENVKLSENFQFVTSIEVSSTDNLPQNVCEKCSTALVLAANVKKKAIISDKELKSYLKNINDTFSLLPSKTKFDEDNDTEEIDLNNLNEFYEQKSESDSENLISENTNDDVEDKCEYQNIELIDESKIDEDDESAIEKILSENDYENVQQDSAEDSEYIDLKYESDNTQDFCETTKKAPNRKKKKRRYVPELIKVSTALRSPERKSKFKFKQSIDLIKDTFRCGECDNSFTTKLNLDRHMEIHLNKRRAYSCETCGKLFTQLNSVKEHMLTHTGEKPFKCPICQKAFSRRQILKRHLLAHSQTEEFECEICNQKFRHQRSLLIHKHRTHGEFRNVEHKCEICSRTYRSKYTLSDHLQNAHNIVP